MAHAKEARPDHTIQAVLARRWSPYSFADKDAMTKLSRNGKSNKAAEHDLGLAAGNLCAEATARGLFVHQMIGIVPERVRELYGLPEDAQPLTALAIGHAGDGSGLPAALQERDCQPRARRPLREFVFEGSWEQPARLDD